MFNFFLFFLINFFIRFRKHDLKVAFDGNFEFVSQILVSIQLMCIYAQYRPFLNDCLLSCQIVFQVIRKYALNKPWIMGFLMDIFGALLMLRALSLAPVSTLHCDICIKLPDCITFSGFGIFFFSRYLLSNQFLAVDLLYFLYFPTFIWRKPWMLLIG